MSTPQQHCERNIIRRLRRIEKLLRRIDDKTSKATCLKRKNAWTLTSRCQ
jgi:hypothetical protein